MFFENKSRLFIGRFARLFGSEVVSHGFSTRRGGISQNPFDTLNLGDRTGDCEKNVQTNRDSFFQSLGILSERLAIPVQIHGNHVVLVEKPGIYPETDGMITEVQGICLVVQVADCLPVYLYDPIRQAIGLVHAGWRGTCQKIITQAIQSMESNFGTCAENILVFIGPSIGPCCYEVNGDVSRHFPESVVQGSRLDLWQANQNLLIESGVRLENISVSGLCTSCYSDWFFSHRRSGGKTGRMMAVFGLKQA
jgi:YfiH family protein